MAQTAPPPPEGMIRLGGTPPLRIYLSQLWERREFAWAHATGDLRSQHLDTTLGHVWHLLNPALQILIYYAVFGILLDTSRGVDNFIAFLTIGVFAYSWAQKSISGGARAIISNEGLIRSLQFPRAILPVSTVLKEALAFFPGVTLMVVVVLITGEGVSPSWILAAPIFLLQAMFGLGAAFLTARAADKFRDIQNLLPHLFRLVFYTSGILYAVDHRFHSAFENPWLVRIFIGNPFYCFITLWREAFMTTQQAPLVGWTWISATIWAVAVLIAGLFVFRAGEKEYGRG